MKKIHMVDLQTQYKFIKTNVDAGIEQVLNSAQFINGPAVKSFQKNLESYLGVKNVIPCANGTDALQIAMMGLGLKPGDEVITADFTYASTVEVIALLGLTPVLVDVDPITFNINPESIEKVITKKTKAIVPVHLFGQVAQMEKIIQIAKKHGIFVIEDNAQALGANFTYSNGNKVKAGCIGDIGTTSFFPSKNLGCYGDGGAIFTNDDELAHLIRGIANHGMYERYYHDVVGVNSRLDSIQAVVLDEKLKHLDLYNKRRRESALKYSEYFENNTKIITPIILGDSDSHVFHQYTLKIIDSDRNALGAHLSKNNIPFGVYYPVPLHLQKAYQDKKYLEMDFSVTNKLINQVISLPMHSELDNEQIDFISSKVLEFVN